MFVGYALRSSQGEPRFKKSLIMSKVYVRSSLVLRPAEDFVPF